MLDRQVLRTGGFEDIGGYSRSVRVGPLIMVSATAPTISDGTSVHAGDTYAQAIDAFGHAIAGVVQLGGRIENVARTRIYLTPTADWRQAIDAHRELFAEITPANTTIVVAALIPDGALIEVELDAIILADHDESANVEVTQDTGASDGREIPELWQAEWCPHSHRVRLRLTALGLPFVARQVSPRRDERSEMEALTGVRTIPTLVEGDHVVSGSEQILAHLTAMHGQERSSGGDHLAIMQEEWPHWRALHD